MARKMLIDATHPEETRVVVADGKRVEEFDFETQSKLRLAGNIYLAKVARVEPSLQAAFVDYGGNRHGFLPFSEIHPDYYQIPVADREALLVEEETVDGSPAAEAESGGSGRSRRGRSRAAAEAARPKDAVNVAPTGSERIPGMGVVDLDIDGDVAETAGIGASPDAEARASAHGRDGTAAALTPDDSAQAGIETPDAAEDGVDEDGDGGGDAAGKGDRIESGTGDAVEEARQPRKPRPRPYKIQEVMKVRQILLVQVIKEERGNKGAALTTYISLAGRYCVLMPNTARGGGISRKITNAPDRGKLKEIASGLDVPKGAGLIIRTAGANRTKSELKRDYEFLQRLWERIRALTLASIAPVQIYEEGNLVKRSIRDLYSREIEEVLVEGEAGYRTAKDFMKMIMPSHAKRVKSYQDPMPLFARYQVESHLSSMYSPTVQLKSGGYIVIGVTEALVAIDVNSGRATREGSVEVTALKTNLEAAEEIARQLRLRDLAGLIVIDFIDMDERRNNAAVEKRFKDGLRPDRARIQVGSISEFGLLEMSRQRQRLGMIEATTQACPACHGTGRVRSDGSLALGVLRELEEEGTRGRHRELSLKAPVGLVNFLINRKRGHVAEIESRYGITVHIEADASMVSPDYVVERLKSATAAQRRAGPVISANASMMPEHDGEDEASESVEDTTRSEGSRSRSRRRNRGGRRAGGGAIAAETATDAADTAGDDGSKEASPGGGEGGKRSGGRRRSKARASVTAEDPSAKADVTSANAEGAGDAVASSTPAPETKPKRSRRRRAGRASGKADGQVRETVADPENEAATPETAPVPASDAGAEPDRHGSPESPGSDTPEPAPVPGPETARSPDGPAPGADTDPTGLPGRQDTLPEPDPDGPRGDTPKPKRRGWWKTQE